MNSKRGELVRGPDPPLVHRADSTAGDLWRAPIRLLLKTRLAAGVYITETKLYRPPPGVRARINEELAKSNFDFLL